MDPATGAAEELTAGSTYHGAPAWSPDGRWLVYTADDGSRSIALEILDLRTGVARRLSTDSANYTDPRFSPDGSRLAYAASAPNGYMNVFVRSITDGRWAGEAIALTDDSRYTVDRPYVTPQDMHFNPVWFPSGRELLLISNRNTPLGTGDIRRVTAQLLSLETGTTVLREHTLYHARPDIAPDGVRFVYSSAKGGTRPFQSLYLVDTRTGSSTPLTDSTRFDALQPRWSPDGQSIAFITNETGTPGLALLDVVTGRVRAVPITSRRWKRPAGRLELRIFTGSSTEPTSARVHLTASDGRLYAPDDAFARVSWTNDRLFHVTGPARIELPAGPVELTVVKGFEHAVLRRRVTVEDGATLTLDLRLDPIDDLPSRGWYPGSTGAHVHGGGQLRADLGALLDLAEAEGQQFTFFPYAHQDARVRDRELWVFGDSAHPISRPNNLLTLGQEHRPPFHGHVVTVGLRERMPSLFPVTVGYEGGAPGTLAPSNTDVLEAAKRKGAMTGYVHAFAGENDPIREGLGLGKAFMVDAALGTVDVLEWAAAGRGSFVPWYAALNNGLRVKAMGGEDTIANFAISRLIGSVRTYAHCAGPLTPDCWWTAVREGRSFVTTGPLLGMTVDGISAGGEVQLAGAQTITVAGWVKSITPLSMVLLVQDGQVIDTIPLGANRMEAQFSRTVRVTRSGWFHLRAEGDPAERFPLDAIYAQGFTNPVWVTVDGKVPRDAAAAEYGIRWITLLRVMAEAWPGWTDEAERAHVLGQFERARQVYQRLAAEANAP